MIIIKKDCPYTSNKSCVQGAGFMDSLSSGLRNVGSYILQNKDLIAKPMLGAAGNLAALGFTEGAIAIAKKIANKNNKSKAIDSQQFQKTMLNPNNQELLQKLLSGSLPETKNISTSNIIGSGIKII